VKNNGKLYGFQESSKMLKNSGFFPLFFKFFSKKKSSFGIGKTQKFLEKKEATNQRKKIVQIPVILNYFEVSSCPEA
jgi:hypothetical protein